MLQIRFSKILNVYLWPKDSIKYMFHRTKSFKHNQDFQALDEVFEALKEKQ